MSETQANTYRGAHAVKSPKRKKKWDKKSKILLTIGLALFIVAAILAGVMVYGYLDARARYENAQNISGVDQSLIDAIFSGAASLLELNLDWDALREVNPDIVGWIYVENSTISYPIVQGDDNDYYLTHLFDGTYSSSGCIFLDADDSSDMSSDNNLIYGHNMLDGSMFASLLDFKDQSYLDQGYDIIIVTPTDAFLLSPAFTYVCEGTDERVRRFNFSTSQDMKNYINNMLEMAVTESVVDFDEVDKIFSLVTCSYEANNVRTVLVCVQRDAVTFADSD